MVVWLILLFLTPCLAAVPDRVCAKCHAEIAARYGKTAMAQSSGAVARLRPPPGAPALGVGGQGWKLRVSRRDPPFQHAVAVGWFLGSGRVGRSYLFETQGQLFQFPFSSYAATGQWGASPGFNHAQRFDLNRAVETACLQCHSAITAHPTPAAPELNGISCERCHGAGEAHVRQPSRANIVQPARLDPSRRDSVCSQCHLTGVARVATRRGSEQRFQPGENLADFLAVFVEDSPPGAALTVTGHTERLAASKCKQGSGDRLWCATCHDPHTEPAPAARAAYYQAKCESCHARKATVCREDCVACHMPKSPTQGIDHSASTDHAILRRPREATKSVAQKLRSFLGPATAREEALAWAIAAGKDPVRQSAAVQRLRAVDDPDAAVHLQLAQLLPAGDEQTERYRAALPHPVAAVNLGNILAQAGQLEAAATHWRNALTREPHNSAARLNLVQALLRLGDPAQALAELKQLLVYDPDRPDLRRLLAQLQARLQ